MSSDGALRPCGQFAAGVHRWDRHRAALTVGAASSDYWLLVVVAVAHRRLGPSSSASTSTVDRALPSSAVQVRC